MVSLIRREKVVHKRFSHSTGKDGFNNPVEVFSAPVEVEAKVWPGGTSDVTNNRDGWVVEFTLSLPDGHIVDPRDVFIVRGQELGIVGKPTAYPTLAFGLVTGVVVEVGTVEG